MIPNSLIASGLCTLLISAGCASVSVKSDLALTDHFFAPDVSPVNGPLAVENPDESTVSLPPSVFVGESILLGESSASTSHESSPDEVVVPIILEDGSSADFTIKYADRALIRSFLTGNSASVPPDGCGVAFCPAFATSIQRVSEERTGSNVSGGSIGIADMRDICRRIVRGVRALRTGDWGLLNSVNQHLRQARSCVPQDGHPRQTECSISVLHVTYTYMTLYLRGEYVTRQGIKLKKPEIGSEVSNETIVALETVLLDALMDYMWPTPVLYKIGDDGKRTYLNSSGDAPAILVAIPGLASLVQVAPNVGDDFKDWGITETEHETAVFFHELASDQSKHISGLIIKAAADIELSFVIGGHISVGDNETFAKMVETFFEVLARNSVRAITYNCFIHFRYHINPEEDDQIELTDADRTYNRQVLLMSDTKQDLIVLFMNNQKLITEIIGNISD